MNVEQANSIALSEILKTIGFFTVEEKGINLKYFSPLRKEKTPSFHVNLAKNIWYDFGEAKGGNAIDFVCAYLEIRNEDHTVVDALRWLRNIRPFAHQEVCSKEEVVNYGATLELRKATALQNSMLIDYLSSRGIPHSYAKKYLKEVHVRNAHTGKIFYAIGLVNENGGFELRNKFFKGCIAPKEISFIRGRKQLPEEIHVFEGFMDFLSAIVHQKANRFEGDVIVLNSLACLSKAFPYIKDYSYKILYTWFDNDDAGKKATQVLKEFSSKHSLTHKPMNEIYDGHKDVNAWHMHRIELK